MIICATGPTILVTGKITTQQVMHMLLSKLFGFSLLKLFFKLFLLLGQISHLVWISANLFPGLLCGIEGLSRRVLLLALQYLVEGPFLGARPLELPTFPRFPGMCLPVLGTVPALTLVALVFSLYLSMKTFSMFSRSWTIALGDSETVLLFILYWFRHAMRQVAMMIPAAVALLNAMFLFLVEATADALYLSIDNKVS